LPVSRLFSQIFWVLTLGTLWGINWPAVKFLLTELPPLSIRAIAFPLAALLLALVVRYRGERLIPARRDWVHIGITGLFIIFGFNVLATLGQVYTEASRAAIIAYTMPAITGVLAVIFLRDALSLRTIASLGLGMTGIAVLAFEDIAALMANPHGVIIMLCAALSWSIGNVLLKARQWSIGPLALTVWFFAVSAALCWPLVFVLEPPWQQTWPSPTILLTLVYHVLGPMVICYAIWTSIVGRLPMTIAAISALTAPVVGVLSSAFLLAEPLTATKLISLGLIVFSVLLTFNVRVSRD